MLVPDSTDCVSDVSDAYVFADCVSDVSHAYVFAFSVLFKSTAPVGLLYSICVFVFPGFPRNNSYIRLFIGAARYRFISLSSFELDSHRVQIYPNRKIQIYWIA